MSAAPHIKPEQLEEIIARVPNGMSLKRSCEIAGLEYSNVVKRISKDETLSQLLARAREDYQSLRVDEMCEIAASEKDVQRARLICDNIKWEAARISPKRYGDKSIAELTGKDGGPIEVADRAGASEAIRSLVSALTAERSNRNNGKTEVDSGSKS